MKKIEIEVNCFQIEKQADALAIHGLGEVKIDGINSLSHIITATYEEDKKYKITIEELKYGK